MADETTALEPSAEPADREHRAESVVPAGLAAVAEAGIVFLLVEVAARSTVLHPPGGPLAWYPLFLALFVGGVTAGTYWREWRGMPACVVAGCIAVGVVQSLQSDSLAVALAAALKTPGSFPVFFRNF